MTYLYLKALHIIFVVTWFAALFYMPRLFIYNTEALQKDNAAREVLQSQFQIMMKRLWYGIAWPSAIISLILGTSLLIQTGYWELIFTNPFRWLLLKLCFVVALFGYHVSLHRLMSQQVKGLFKYTSQQLRIWNEVATIFLFAIVMLVVVKQEMSLLYGTLGLILLILLLMSAIKIYKLLRRK